MGILFIDIHLTTYHFLKEQHMSTRECECERWIIAQKMVPVINGETMRKIVDLGGQVGGGWNLIHQHISVNPYNRFSIEQLLLDQEFDIVTTSEVRHPEV